MSRNRFRLANETQTNFKVERAGDPGRFTLVDLNAVHRLLEID